MTDIFTEVEEEFRRDRLKSAWKRFGYVPIGIAVLLVLATAGFKGYEYWQQSTAARDGDRFVAAIDLATDGDHEAARQALLALAEDGSAGYAVIARFRAATEAANAGDDEGALATFRAMASDTSVPEAYRSIAEIRAGYLAVDTESYSELLRRIGHMAQGDGPWVLHANEILGLAAYRENDLETARTHFDEIVDAAGTTSEMNQRVRVMSGLIRATLGEAESSEAPADDAEAPIEAESATPPAADDADGNDTDEVSQ